MVIWLLNNLSNYNVAANIVNIASEWHKRETNGAIKMNQS